MNGIALIAAERRRQVEEEGWTAQHDDDTHRDETLAAAGVAYADLARLQLQGDREKMVKELLCGSIPRVWPWDGRWWKPDADPVRNLVKAGALLAAAIDRLQRQAGEAVPAVAAQTERERTLELALSRLLPVAESLMEHRQRLQHGAHIDRCPICAPVHAARAALAGMMPDVLAGLVQDLTALADRRAAALAEAESELERYDAESARVRVALTEAGVPESEPYPEPEGGWPDDFERSLHAGGRMIPPHERVRRLAAHAKLLSTELHAANGRVAWFERQAVAVREVLPGEAGKRAIAAEAEARRLRGVLAREHTRGRRIAGLFGECPCDDCLAHRAEEGKHG